MPMPDWFDPSMLIGGQMPPQQPYLPPGLLQRMPPGMPPGAGPAMPMQNALQGLPGQMGQMPPNLMQLLRLRLGQQVPPGMY